MVVAAAAAAAAAAVWWWPRTAAQGEEANPPGWSSSKAEAHLLTVTLECIQPLHTHATAPAAITVQCCWHQWRERWRWRTRVTATADTRPLMPEFLGGSSGVPPTGRCLEWAKELAEAELRARVRGRASRDAAGDSSRASPSKPYPPSPPSAVLPLEACSPKPFPRCRWYACRANASCTCAPGVGVGAGVGDEELGRRTTASRPRGFPDTRLRTPAPSVV